MHRRLILPLIALAAFYSAVSCMQEMNGVDTRSSLEDSIVTETGAIVPKSSIEPGHIRVFLTDDFNVQAKRLVNEDGVFPIADVKSSGMDFVSMIGVKKMCRTFPYAGRFEARTVAAGLDKWYDIWFDENVPVDEAVRSLSGTECFVLAECRPKMVRYFDDNAEPVLMPYPGMTSAAQTSADVFNDPMLKDQWHYYNDGSKNGMTAGCDINVVPVWESVTTGNPDVIVAVVDGGVQYDHEDLAANMWHNPANKQNPYGYNFVNSTYVIHPHDHGTHVAGTIAAVNNNGIGVSGVAGGNAAKGQSGVQIMSCQIFDGDDDGSGAAAIKWAADHGAVIAQNSWGYPDLTYLPASDRQAIDYFNANAGIDENGNQVGPMAGGIVIFAAGNENRDYSYPSVYEGTLAVASVGADFNRAYYSCYGDWVDVAAPGGDARKGYQVLSTLPGNRYGKMQGTSMACPHVSGVAALVISKYGGVGFTRDMLWNRLVNTTNSITCNKYNKTTYVAGLVDALAASAKLGTVPPENVSGFSAEALNSNFVKFTVTVPADEDDGTAFGLNVYYDTEPIVSTVGVPAKSFRFGGLDAGAEFSDTLSGLGFDTQYYLRCVAYDMSGNISDLSDEVIVTTSKNLPPVISYPSDLVFELRAHETKYIPFSYSDPDGHSMSPYLTTDSEADTLMILDRTKSQIVLEGVNGKPGTYTSVVCVKDEFDASAEFSYTFTIYPNHAPVLRKNVPDQLFTQIGTPCDLVLDEYIYDEDGEILKLSVEDGGMGVVNVSIINGHLYITPLKLGSDHIRMTVSDAFGETVSTEFDVAVRSGDDPLAIYPNPVKTNLYISTGAEESDTHIVVAGQTGKVVYDEKLKTSAFSPAVVDMKGCAPGVYSVKVEYCGETYIKTIVKI